MTDSLKLAEMQRTSIEFERQRHLANWFIKSSPHMAQPPAGPTASGPSATAITTATTTHTTTATTTAATTANTTSGNGTTGHGTGTNNGTTSNSNTATTTTAVTANTHHHNNKHTTGNPVFFLMSSNGNTGAVHHQQQQPHHHHNNGSGGGGKHHGGSGGGGCPSAGAGAPAGGAAAISGACGIGISSGGVHLGGPVEGRKPKLRRFNSHDTGANMFSVADFENARLARRNEIELKQRLQRRMRMSANGGSGGISAGLGGCGSGMGYGGCGVLAGGCGNMIGDYSTGDSKSSKYSNEYQQEPLPADIFLDRYSLPRVVRISYKTKFCDETLQSSSSNGSSTVTSHSSNSGGVGVFVGPIAAVEHMGGNNNSTGTTSNTGTSSSNASSSGNLNGSANNTSGSNGSKQGAGNPIALSNGSNNSHHHHHQQQQQHGVVATASNTNASSTNCVVDNQQDHGELFLLYRLVRQRHIYHGHNAKTATANRKKGVLIPQEFPGYFSLLNEKGLPTATLYTTLLQLVRERVYKFVSVDNMPAFTESPPANAASNPPAHEGCLPIYSSPPPSNRPQYVKTTARGGQVFRLLAVFEDGKQEHNNSSGSGSGGGSSGREKEKGRYAQLLNENRQVLYVSLATKGKFYEIEPGIPQILQKLSSGFGAGNTNNLETNKRLNPDCVHRITALVTPSKQLPLTLRYISGPCGTIPEQLCITRINTENVVVACPIEEEGNVGAQNTLQLRKLHLTKEMQLLRSTLGCENEQRMLANPNVQNMLKFCQFNCDPFLKLVEVEMLTRPAASERTGSKSRVDGLKLLKPLHLPKLLRREKTTLPAHEKEDSIIFLSKSDLANLEAKERINSSQTLEAATPSTAGNRISDKMKVFQSTKKKWFRRQQSKQHSTSAAVATTDSLTSLELEVQAKRLSMERYSDMSKLLQERFGDHKANCNAGPQEHESVSEPSGASDLGCSDTETTTLATIEEKYRCKYGGPSKVADTLLQKSMSLQDIELISGDIEGGRRAHKPDLLPADTISEAGSDLTDLENRPPDSATPQQHSFITEKLYNEFHVKTRQYSKSSSSLPQLLNFSLPQKLQVHQNATDKRTLAQLKQAQGATSKRPQFNIGEPVTGRRAAGGLSLLVGGSGGSGAGVSHSLTSPAPSPLVITPATISLIEDDLPYSSVRDSLIYSSDGEDQPSAAGVCIGGGGGNICQALHLIDYAKENIYAEICHDNTRDTLSGDTHSTLISDDYGDYASLSYPTTTAAAAAAATVTVTPNICTQQNGVSRVKINCSPSASPVSYHTVYLGDEPLGEQHAAQRRRHASRMRSRDSSHSQSRDRSHITMLELEGSTQLTSIGTSSAAVPSRGPEAALQLQQRGEEGLDNIYNTLK